MKHKTTKSVEVRLILTESEARLLMGLVQNFPGSPEDEDPECAEFRENLFNILKASVGPAF